jgi:hypothetical protein
MGPNTIKGDSHRQKHESMQRLQAISIRVVQPHIVGPIIGADRDPVRALVVGAIESRLELRRLLIKKTLKSGKYLTDLFGLS